MPLSTPIACTSCGIHSLLCQACDKRRAVSIVRCGFENLTWRARHGLLVVLCAHLAAVVFVASMFVIGSIESLRLWLMYEDVQTMHSFPLLSHVIDLLLVAAGLGSLSGLVFITKPGYLAGLLAAAVYLFWPIVLSADHLDYPPVFLWLIALAMVCAYVSARAAPTVTALAARVLLPGRASVELFDWLHGRRPARAELHPVSTTAAALHG